jgi:adenylate kinase
VESGGLSQLAAPFASTTELTPFIQSGLVDNIDMVISEFRTARGLTPIKIVVHGPPSSGKSTLASLLAEEYQIHHITLDSVVADLMQEAVGTNNADLLQLLNESKDDATANNHIPTAVQTAVDIGRFSEETLVQLVRYKLSSWPCQNQGFILDDFPRTTKQATLLFSAANPGMYCVAT